MDRFDDYSIIESELIEHGEILEDSSIFDQIWDAPQSVYISANQPIILNPTCNNGRVFESHSLQNQTGLLGDKSELVAWSHKAV